MAYSRVGPDSDVYVFYNTGDFYECCGCRLQRPDPMYRTAEEMLKHLREHAEAGHMVPDDAVEALAEEFAHELHAKYDNEGDSLMGANNVTRGK